METIIFEVIFNNGRTFRVFCANSNQKNRFKTSLVNLGKPCKFKTITNGIHTISQWEKILKTI